MDFSTQMELMNAAQRILAEAEQHDDGLRRALEKLAVSYFWRSVGLEGGAVTRTALPARPTLEE